MTEQQAFNYLAKRLPPDAIIFVDRYGHKWRSRGGGESEKEWWKVTVRHEATGYLFHHAAKAGNARDAINIALEKWQAYQRRRERDGLPRWVSLRIGRDRFDFRVRLTADRLFVNDGDGARECSYFVDPSERRIDVAGCVPKHQRPFLLLCAVGHTREVMERQPHRRAA